MFKINNTILACAVFMTLSVFYGYAQAVEIKGKLTDAVTNDPIPGASVLVKNSTTGTSTDFDGLFTINAASEDILVFSYVGFKTVEIQVGNQLEINVKLEEDLMALDEMVVVGYGSLKKGDLTGSLSKVSGEFISELKTASFDQALQGAAAGLQVNTAGGIPGGPIKIQVRGTNSIAGGTTPLFIIDGLPMSSSLDNSTDINPMTFLNPEDIESVEVLKDASATAIYGSRGANGVILITTKSGKNGVSRTDVNITSGISFAFNLPELASTDQWFSVMDQARENAGLTPIGADDIIVGPGSIFRFFSEESQILTRRQAEQVNTNFFDETLRTGYTTDINVSHSGGTEKSDYFLSAGYRNDKSVYESSEFERFSLRSNLNSQLGKYVKAGARLSWSAVLEDRPLLRQGFRGAARNYQPWLPLINTETGLPNDPKAGYNPIYELNDDYRFTKLETYRSVNNVFVDVEMPFMKELHVRSEVGFDIRNVIRNDFESFFIAIYGSEASQRHIQNTSLNTNLYLTFDKTFGDHYINAAAGVEQNKRKTRYAIVTGTGPDQRTDINEPGTVTDVNFKQDLAGTIDDVRFYGLFGRATYKYKDRYLLNASFRRDGSSKFPDDNEFGTFLAGSLGYVVSKEEFWPVNFPMNFLKVRASYGEVGNDQIPSGLGLDQYLVWPRYGNDQGTVLTSIGNSSISWESITTTEVGMDFGLFKNRISGSFAYYNMRSEDLLFPAPAPSSFGAAPTGGFNSQWTNFADMTNSGVEIELQGFAFDKPDFSWDISMNLTFNSAVVDNIFVTEGTEAQNSYLGFEILSPNIVLREGDPLAIYAIPLYAGIDSAGRELIYEIDNNGNKTGETVLLTPDGALNNRYVDPDKTSQPTYWGGLTNNFRYKNFSLNVFLAFQGGNYLLDTYLRDLSYINQGTTAILADVAENRWQNIFSDANSLPAPDWQRSGNLISDRFLYKGDFVKLRSVRFSYDLPDKVLDKLSLSRAQVYVVGNNLLTWTAHEGLDPEVVRTTSGGNVESLADFNLGQGIIRSGSVLPQVSNVNLGLTLGF